MRSPLPKDSDVQLYYCRIMSHKINASINALNKRFTENHDIILAISALGPHSEMFFSMDRVTPLADATRIHTDFLYYALTHAKHILARSSPTMSQMSKEIEDRRVRKCMRYLRWL